MYLQQNMYNKNQAEGFHSKFSKVNSLIKKSLLALPEIRQRKNRLHSLTIQFKLKKNYYEKFFYLVFIDFKGL